VRPARARPALSARSVLSVALTLALTACTAVPATGPGSAPAPIAPADGAEAPLGGGTLRFALGADPVSIDPRSLVDPEGELVARALFEPPLDVDPEGRIVPAGAERFAWSEDGLSLTLELRRATFHDGSPVTAEHHARAFARVADDAVAPRFRSDLLDGVTAVEVVDARTLVVRLAEPRPGLLLALTDLAFAPVPDRAETDPEGFAARPIGNGPFAMAEPRSPGEFIRLARVADHHRRPVLDEVLFVVQADDPSGEERWRDLEAGLLQVSEVPAGRRSEAAARHGSSLDGLTGPGFLSTTLAAMQHYAFDVTLAPFDDVVLRRAISAAIDRERLATEVLAGTALAADRILPPALVPGVYDGGVDDGSVGEDASTVEPAVDCGHCRHDPELARALLADWRSARGGDAPLELTLTYPRTPSNAAVAESIARDLEAVLGAQVRLQGRDLAGFVRAVEAGEAPLFRLGQSVASDGPRAIAELLVPRFRPDRPESWTGFDAPGLTRRLDALAADPTGGLELAREVEAALLDAAVVVPLVWPRRDVVVADEVRGLVLTPGGRWWPELVRLEPSCAGPGCPTGAGARAAAPEPVRRPFVGRYDPDRRGLSAAHARVAELADAHG